MSTRPQSPIPSEGEGQPLAPGHAIPPIDIRAVFTALDLYRSLGRLEKATEVLEAKVARQEQDLNGLGKVAHGAKLFGNIALVLIGSGVALVIAILSFLSHHLVFK